MSSARKPTDPESDVVVLVARMLTPEEVKARETEVVELTPAAKQWRDQNAEAIAAYNEEIARRGVFGEDLRTW